MYEIVPQQNLATNILETLDKINRVGSMVIFGFYFALLIFCERLKRPQWFYVHHANLVGFLFCFMFIIYFNVSPFSVDSNLKEIYCPLSELLWAILKFVRAYSILMIAFYRYFEICQKSWLKKFNNTKRMMFMQVAVLWIVAVLFSVVMKYSLGTSYRVIYCLDGYSTSVVNEIVYQVVSMLVISVIPFFVTLFIALKIRAMLKRRVNEIKYRLAVLKSREHVYFLRLRYCFNFVDSDARNAQAGLEEKLARRDYRQNRRLNVQLYLLNSCYLMCFTTLFVLNLNYLIPGFLKNYYFITQILRILTIAFQSLIPIISLRFNFPIKNKAKRLRQLYERMKTRLSFLIPKKIHPSY